MMKSFLFALCLLFLTCVAFAQNAPQYNYTRVLGVGNATAGVMTYFTLQLVDSNNKTTQYCPSSTSMFSVQVTGPQNIKGNLAVCQSGVIRVSWSSTVAGPYKVTVGVTVGTNMTILGVYSVYNFAGQIDPPTCSATGNLTGGVVGQTYQFTITARDQYGNINPVCTPNFWSVTLTSGGTQLQGIVKSTCPAPGLYVVTYSPKIKGIYSMVVRGNGYNIKGSPFTVMMTPGPFSSKNAVVNGLVSSIQAGQELAFTISSFDQFKNQITTCFGPETLQWNNTLQLKNKIVAPIKGDGNPNCTNGVYFFRITGQTYASPNYQIVLSANSTPISSSPYTLAITPASQISASLCNATGDGLYHGVAGLPSLINITAYDIYDNVISSCDVTAPQNFQFQLAGVQNSSIVCSGTGQTCIDGDFTSGTPAVFQGNWFCDVATTYALTILFGNDPFNQTYHPQVRPGVLSGPASSAFGPGTVVAYAGETSYVFVDPYDQYGNPIPDCSSQYLIGDSFSILVTNNTGASVPGRFNSCVETSSGKPNISLTYTLTSIFITDLQITYNGQNLNPGTFQLETYPGPPGAGHCHANGSGIYNATAGEEALFSVSCLDAYDNPISSCSAYDNWFFTLAYLPGGNPTVSGPAISCDDSGTLAYTTFRYIATKAGEYSLDYLYDGASLQDLHNVTIFAGALDIANTIADGVGVLGDHIQAGSNVSFNIFARDHWNNSIETCLNISNDGLAFKFTPSTNQLSNLTILPCSPPDYNVTVWYNSTLATTYTVDITYGSKAIRSSPYHPTWIAGPIDASKITAYGPGLFHATAGQPAPINLTATDIYGNPVTDCFDFNFQDWELVLNYLNGTALTVDTSFIGCSAGVILSNYTAYTAGTYNVSIFYKETEIPLKTRYPVVLHAAVNDMNALVFGPGFEPEDNRIIAGVSQNIYVLPRDSWNNSITSCPSGLKYTATFVTVDNANKNQAFSSPCVSSTGYFPIYYTQTRATDWNINVTGQVQPLDGTSRISVYPANISASHSNGYQSSYKNLVAGSDVTIQLSLADRFSNNITECDYSNTSLWNIYARLTTDSSVTFFALPVSCNEGQFSTKYSVQRFGIYHVYLTYGNLSLANSGYTVTFIAGTVDADHSWAIGDGVNGQSNVAGVLTTFKIYAANQYGIAITDGSLCDDFNSSDWTVQFDQSYAWNDPSQTSAAVTKCDDNNGSFSGSYIPTRARTYTVQIALNNNLIGRNPYKPTVVPAVVYPPYTTILGLNGTSGDNGTFYLQTRDRFFNNETNVNKSNFNIALSPTCALTYLSTYNAGNGLLRVDWSVTEGGVYCVNIAFNGSFYPLLDATIHALGGTGCNNSCSTKGYCFRNMEPSTVETNFSCNCFQGWTGEDCSVKISSKYPLAVGAIVGLVIGLGILMFIIGLILGFFLLRFLRRGDDHHTLLD